MGKQKFYNYYRDYYDETVSTLKFADRAKSILTRIKPNEIIANDENLVNKLIKEINELKSILAMRKRRGNIGEFDDQFIKLKEENEKLKKYVMVNTSNENIEKLISENKILKLELQKLKSKNEFYKVGKNSNNTNDYIDNLSTSKNLTNSVKSGIDFVLPNYNYSIKTSSMPLSNNSLLTKSSDNLIDIQNQNLHKNEKLVRAGLQVLINNNTNTGGIDLGSSHVLNEIKELKAANQRLKFLEQMEQKSGLKMLKEIEKLNCQKMKKSEEISAKKFERQKDIERMEGHIKRINYLYKDNTNIFSDYLIESTVKRKNIPPVVQKDLMSSNAYKDNYKSSLNIKI